MAYKIDDNTLYIQTRMKTNVPVALRLMLNAVHNEANPKTPLQDSDLRGNVKKTVLGSRGKITWGMVYAQYQERGKRKDGTHVVKRYTTPGTGKGFAKNAVSKVGRRAKRYFKMARVV